MKRFIFISTAFLLVSFYAFGQNSNSKSLPEFFKLRFETPEYIYGSVKEIHCETFDAIEQNGKIVLQGKLLVNSWQHQICTWFLNPKGQIIQMNASNLAGNYKGIFNYRDGKLMNLFWLKNDTLDSKWDYTYPNEEKVIETFFIIQDNNNDGANYFDVDINGLIMNRVFKNKNGEQEGNSVVYEREKNGTITDKKAISPDGKIMQHYDDWNYDDKGNKFKIHRAILQGEKVDFYGATHTFEYDDRGNWIKRTSIYPNTNIRVTIRKFVFY